MIYVRVWKVEEENWDRRSKREAVVKEVEVKTKITSVQLPKITFDTSDFVKKSTCVLNGQQDGIAWPQLVKA